MKEVIENVGSKNEYCLENILEKVTRFAEDDGRRLNNEILYQSTDYCYLNKDISL